jgi:hypothetical protein
MVLAVQILGWVWFYIKWVWFQSLRRACFISAAESTLAARSVTVLEAELPLHPSQPTEVVFPWRLFGKTNLSFQSSWFSQWKWLHYDAASDLAYCFICVKAIQTGIGPSNL